MKQQLPQWRIDNLYAFIGSVILVVTTLGGVFYRQGLSDQKIEQMIAVQKELTQEVRAWKIQFEGRLGQEEKNSVLFANVLKLTIK